MLSPPISAVALLRDSRSKSISDDRAAVPLLELLLYARTRQLCVYSNSHVMCARFTPIAHLTRPTESRCFTGHSAMFLSPSLSESPGKIVFLLFKWIHPLLEVNDSGYLLLHRLPRCCSLIMSHYSA